MKKQLLLIGLLFIATLWVTAQNVTLKFTAEDVDKQNVPFDSVIVTNLTKNWQKIVVWPDSVLSFAPNSGYAGNAGILLSQNMPNPFVGKTDVQLFSLYEGVTTLEIMDLNGKMLTDRMFTLSAPGTHLFHISLAKAGVYVLVARQGGRKSSIKMICKEGSGSNSIEYSGDVPTPEYVLHSDATNCLFDLGDKMEYIGYVTIDGIEMESRHVKQSQVGSQTVLLSFLDYNFVCGTTTISDYDENVYHTILVGQQCWLKENMRATKLEDGTAIAYSNYESSNIPLEARGYFYPQETAVKICPAGWRLPSVDDWTKLASYVSSQAEYLCTFGPDNSGNAKALASTSYWNLSETACSAGYSPESNNYSGFSAVPAGFRMYPDFTKANEQACFSSSTTYTQWYGAHQGPTYVRLFILDYDKANTTILSAPIQGNYNVRCVRNSQIVPSRQ